MYAQDGEYGTCGVSRVNSDSINLICLSGVSGCESFILIFSYC